MRGSESDTDMRKLNTCEPFLATVDAFCDVRLTIIQVQEWFLMSEQMNFNFFFVMHQWMVGIVVGNTLRIVN